MVEKIELSPDESDLLLHSLGLTKFNSLDMYRNYFITNSDTEDYRICMSLVSKKLMSPPRNMIYSGTIYFSVNNEGIKVGKFIADKKFKLTASQKRYRKWLQYTEAFPDITFGEFLKAKIYKLV